MAENDENKDNKRLNFILLAILLINILDFITRLIKE